MDEIKLTYEFNLRNAGFDDRELKELMFAITYYAHFSHGTSGHLSYTVIAKLYKVLSDALSDLYLEMD